MAESCAKRLSRTLPRLLATLVLAGTAVGQDVVVGSKSFTESRLLGEMLTVLLEERLGLEVEHKRGLGGTMVCFEALVGGEIDVYPEYTGTGWATVLKETEKITDPLRAFLHVQAQYRERFDLEWLRPFGFENTYAMALREPLAAELDVHSLSDLVRHGERVRAGFSVEFLNRGDGWAGLRSFYGLELADVKGMEHALAYEAVGAGAVDLVDGYSTDAKLLRYDLRVLKDDRAFFPPYHAAPVARGELLRERPGARAVLESLAFGITEEQMTRLNHRVEDEGAGFREVAVEFLAERGLLERGATDADRRGARNQKGFFPFFAGRWRETLRLLGEHVRLTGLAVLLATLLAVPLGIAITRNRLAERLSLGTAGAVQTIPSLALLAFLIAVPGFGLTTRSAVAALTLYAILPILRNTFTGLRSVDPDLIDAARGIGLTPAQVLLRVQLPLATRTILAGIRIATVLSIGFATLAAFIGAGGLGEPILTGLYLNDTRLILAGALPAALLALVADRALGGVERAMTPRGQREE